MKVTVCDNDFYFQKQIAGFAKRFEKETGLCISLYSLESTAKLYHHMDKYPDMDILFLNMLSREPSGIEAAKRIRETNEKVCIVFVSAIGKYAVQSYEVQAEGYLLKPIGYETFRNKMHTIIRKLEKDKGRFYYDVAKEGQLIIPFDEITYIETNGRNPLLHTVNRDYTSYRNMKEHQALLKPEGFCRCHAAYIVNMQYVRQVDGQDILLKNNKVVHISKTKKREFYNMFMDYINEFYLA